ncbi:MAG TPA: hypothetical protein PLP29_08950 [Candidatus Ozemobacteraceae bacterium]|nr:hypothetical protein [Candidatus Ozemobacteraceae bacterium]
MMHRKNARSRFGQALIVVLMIALVLGILAGAVFQFQRGQIHLLSRGAKDYLALCVAEAGVHAVLAEMKADYQFVTHGNPYIPQKGWTSPAKHKHWLVGNVEGLKLDHAEKGTYTGRLTMKKTRITGEFKVRVKLAGAKNAVETKTVDEAHRYFILEAVGRVGDACRKVEAVLEKYVPGSYMEYDGQVLDLAALGPNRLVPGVVRRGRLYGQEMLKVGKRGVTDAGLELLEMEKISTPGYFKTTSGMRVEFRNGKNGHLKPDADSDLPEGFETFPETGMSKVLCQFVLDGMRGGKSERFPELNPQYWLKAGDPAPIVLVPGFSFKGYHPSKWRNPAKPGEIVYDLKFPDKYFNNGDKTLIYSMVPLRIWGNPPFKALTIVCEKDVYIAGDFNQHPKNPQNWTTGWREYDKELENGTDKNGVMIISMGRIWFDYSNPLNFLREELKVLLDYEIGMRLGGDELNPLAMIPIVYPPRFGTTARDLRLPMLALNFNKISTLFALPKTPPEVIPLTMGSLAVHSALKPLREYLEISENPEVNRQRFGVKGFLARQKIVGAIGGACYMTGILAPFERDIAINMILEQMEKEMDDDPPNKALGIWNSCDRLFKMAVKNPKTGFRLPEMTVNALLIDSAELNARWDALDGAGKVTNELGNIDNEAMRCFRYAGDDTRVILRHHGGMIHLRNRKADVFLDGRFREDQPIVRRRSWDSTFVRGGGDYFPPYPPAAFNIITWRDDTATVDEFNTFD